MPNEIDPWETVLGKAYLHLFNVIDDAVGLLTHEKRIEAEFLLLRAQRETEQFFMDNGWPLDRFTAPKSEA